MQCGMFADYVSGGITRDHLKTKKPDRANGPAFKAGGDYFKSSFTLPSMASAQIS